MALFPKLADSSVDLIVTSPPYDGVRDYKKDEWQIDLPAIGKQISRVLKPGGVCCMVIQDQTKDYKKSLTSFKIIVDWCDNTDLNLWETVIYQRSGHPGNWWSKRLRVDHEYVPIFVKGNKDKGNMPNFFDKEYLKIECKRPGEKPWGAEHTFRNTKGEIVRSEKWANAETKCRGTVWNMEKEKATDNLSKQIKKFRDHPARFPTGLAKDLIMGFSKEGDIVLDPMCGSGTTCAVAKSLRRKYIGFDIIEEYCNLAREFVSSMSK